MSATAQLSKLAELRAKTDRELVSIIDNALEVGLLLAANEPDVDPAGVLHRRAADIYADTVMLVEKVEDVGERQRLEEKLKRLRDRLERRRGAPPWASGDSYDLVLASPTLPGYAPLQPEGDRHASEERNPNRP
jgi:hypothetical protein